MIRPYSNTDKEKLFEIFHLNVPKYFGGEELKDFESYLKKYSDTYYVFTEKDKIIGGGGYHFSDNKTAARISWDLLHPGAQGKGFGKQIVKHCIEKATSESSVKKLVVWTSNQAHQFYGKFGFELQRTKRHYWGKDHDLYIMQMSAKK